MTDVRLSQISIYMYLIKKTNISQKWTKMAKNGSSTYMIFVSFGTPPHKESESAKFRDLYAKMALPWKKHTTAGFDGYG